MNQQKDQDQEDDPWGTQQQKQGEGKSLQELLKEKR
jgi:hypothetical protein